jgi:cyclic beta-1,2-glucan synthetase
MSTIVTAPSPAKPAGIEFVESPLIDPQALGPIRASLLGLEGLEDLARRLADACAVAPTRKASSPLLRRAEENGRVLIQAHQRILREEGRREGRGLDADWLADNFHIVEDVLREIRQDLPRGYDEELPKLLDPLVRGYPRVHALALALVAHTDSELDQARLDRFVQAFQDVTPLTIGELWAWPTMLRLVLVENLRRLADQMTQVWDERDSAEAWSPLCQPGEPIPTLPETMPLSDAFVVRMIQLWRDQGARGSAVLAQIEARLAERGDDANEVLRREHRRQAANQVSVGNCVIGLRLLSALDWNTFVEQHSASEAILRGDPWDVYIHQDFATRDRYRRAVERIAKGSGADERDIARRALGLARSAAATDDVRKHGHVGYYLIDDGRDVLKREFPYRPEWREALHELVLARPRLFYFGLLGVLWLSLLFVFVGLGAAGAGLGIAGGLAIALMVALPTSELVIGLIHHVLTLLLPPRVLPKLDAKDGIPADCATFVVMPSMLVRRESGALLLERLEIHYLANPDPQLRFALLTDFADAPAQTMPEDELYLREALSRVAELNERHAAGGPDRFFVFHRHRVWDPVQRCWMGWERKRGKLAELNRMLRGNRATNYSVISSDPGDLNSVRFVITLDADTQLPRDSARRLVRTLAHPLNQAHFDPIRQRVVSGYGVLQPRVSYHLLAATRSRFAGLLAASAGIDPYATAVSDVYMDLFGIGSFTGKGIYDVDAFEAAAGHTFPDNSILSHDLIEGNYARCGLATDIELFDDFPARYHAYARREHRWVRGDWQLLPWLAPQVPSPDGKRENPLPVVERWKLFDNLRRSLVPPALVLLLALGWTVLPGSPWFWTAIAVATCAVPVLQLFVTTLVSLIRKPSSSVLAAWRETLPPTLGQSSLAFVFVANQARLIVDAIGRTLLRLFITRRDLLEWETAASTERRLGTEMRHFWLSMWPAPVLSTIVLVIVGWARPSALGAALPVLLAWFLSPLVAYWISQPRTVEEETLTQDEKRELRLIARRTWHFFETFVGEVDHWLPPDNFQETPVDRVAHRTSPTNQGLLLISTLAAHDLGYVSVETLLTRLERTFETLDRMERHRGHFYNWYDTRTLRPLPPLYVSTVDSGNFVACLVTLGRGLEEIVVEPAAWASRQAGLADSWMLGLELLKALPKSVELRSAADDQDDAVSRLQALFRETPDDRLAYADWLGRLEAAAVAIHARLTSLAAEEPRLTHEVNPWVNRWLSEIQDRRNELAACAPWLDAVRALDSLVGQEVLDPVLATGWEGLRRLLVAPTSLFSLASVAPGMADELARLSIGTRLSEPFDRLGLSIRQSAARDWIERARKLEQRCDQIVAETDFRFLYKPDRNLFAIGFNLSQGRLDGPCYDLLASESCLSSLLAVARGDAPRRHWFQLGRPFVRTAGRVGLMSWGGTMFEYLMPRLLLRSLPGTLLAEAQRSAVARQMEYGNLEGIPWGISESGFAARFVDGDYQYQSFGIPGLGLKRGLEQDLVVSPYSTALAIAVRPREALANFRRLRAEGAEGPYGFYEAIDYTKERVPKGSRALVVRSYMAHHQGMSLVALANALMEDPMPRRFHSEPMIRAAELLLDERVPRDAPATSLSEAGTGAARVARDEAPLLCRRLSSPATPSPRTHLLSNGRYHVMLTNGGSGSSVWSGLDVTRWREDPTCERWGQFIYVRDVGMNILWSAGHQPVCRHVEDYEVILSSDKAVFRRVDAGIETLLEVTVSPEQPAEVRRVTVSNRSARPRELELTSYAEVVLAPHGGDVAHPAFGKLFLETEWLAGPHALLCRRRPRSPEQRPIWAVHVSSVEAATSGEVQYETDRARFIGRGRTLLEPAALDPGVSLSGTTGPVLDPIMSLRYRIRLEPGSNATLSFTTAVAETREEAIALADHFREPSAVSRAFDLAWAQNVVEHRQRNWSSEQVHLYQRLASHLIFANPTLRADGSIIAENRQGQSALWRYGISGDKPILLTRIAQGEELALARQVVSAHAYLRLKGLEFDLVLLDEQATSYRDELSHELTEVARASEFHEMLDRPGGIFVRKAANMPADDVVLLQAAARVVLVGDRGTLAAQLDRLETIPSLPAPLIPIRARKPWNDVPTRLPDELLFPNGLGGFRPDGREYCVLIQPDARSQKNPLGLMSGDADPPPWLPPAPWINVIANPSCGFLISESGSGYTWTGNSQGNRLTPWYNDPVSDPPGEAIYLRDEESGEVWSPTPLPDQKAQPTLVRHGQGYTTFERNTHGLEHELTLFVPPEDSVKVIRLSVRNVSGQRRRLSATFFAEWVLGTARDNAAMYVSTNVDLETGALLARNPFRADYASEVAFVDVNRRPRTLTADRSEFLGRHGSPTLPDCFARTELSGRVGAGFDPCAAIQTKFDLEPGEGTEVVFLLGEGPDLEAARRVLRRYREIEPVQAALDGVKQQWERLLCTVQVQTPNPAMDLMLNRWLLYQVLSCRVWARSAFYQSGGAYGFRDQLQDVMALVYGAPEETRAQLLRAAARQFVEGDVQHWWHPPRGRGVRTRFSDDLLWLPLVTCQYVSTTNDWSVLDEIVPYITGPLLKPDQEEDYGLPVTSSQSSSLYDHCVRALERGYRVGEHGLPLMGTGDWNDGMNRVGSGGKGESVWDAWFLMTILNRFGPLAEARGDVACAHWCRTSAESLREAIEEHAWDGQWYRRAYFDDGTPLGSAQNDECQIDSIAQTWAVISGKADRERAIRAMESLEERLVREDDGLILLFSPPFDHGALQPGYIKGYVPGIRENGGQYTHAATWVVLAEALVGRGRRAVELFDLLNPIHHTASPEGVEKYKVEPYVIVADVYGRPPHTGRGGWTWYSGSAAWFYRVGLESILGFQLQGDRLRIDPCVPADWRGYQVDFRRGASMYHISVENPDGLERGVRELSFDGEVRREGSLTLVDDGQEHRIRVVLG